MKLHRTGLLPRKDATKEPEYIFVIATEGQHTEPQYFSMPVLRASETIHIEVLPTLDGKSAPEHVFERLKVLDDRYEFEDGDELWLVVDKDHWDIEALRKPLLKTRYHLAVSNPCFELWLVLHFDEHDSSDTQCKHLKKRFRSHVGKHKEGHPHRPLYSLTSILEAIQRAKVIDTGSDQLCPDFPATHVYRLVEKLLEFGQS